MKSESSSSRGKLEVFDSFEEAKAVEREEWMAMTGRDKMTLLESLRKQTYPHERGTAQGLQRVFAIVD
ncbi:hypothetical protein [Roseibacillus ishigakijimensis]|uniref:Uncharacterized protein n=1 Tax=Roseibacillus ishigakijimensis TaxID=454146 RepID=A0A934RM01_9BACT|nr:hypothetical protein [Roseibacillus ishigakijimensis]MBK1833288.1 hypothetical protein [Roseibacillus ishigakijimensis]